MFEKIIEFYIARKLIILILTAEASISAYLITSFFLYIRPYYYNCMSYADKIKLFILILHTSYIQLILFLFLFPPPLQENDRKNP